MIRQSANPLNLMPYNFHGVDFTYYKDRGWTFKFCNQDGCFYAYETDKGAVKKVIVAPTPTELRNRITDYKPME